MDPLRGIDLVVFDKDGTLIDFQQMWGGWVRDLVAGLERETGRPFATRLHDVLGVDLATGLVEGHGLLAATPMARIREVVLAVVADELRAADGASAPNRASAMDRAGAAVDAVWAPPDPVNLARPVGDLRGLLERIRVDGRRIAVATSDDREPTERTLTALGIAGLIDGLVCADDGILPKPAPDAVRHLCASLDVVPARTAVVGDSVADLAMARAAGAGRVIGVLTGVADRATLEPLSDLILGSVEELLAHA